MADPLSCETCDSFSTKRFCSACHNFSHWVRKTKGSEVTTISDGATATYYELPPWAIELADLIRYKKMNGSQAEMFRALYRRNEASHSDERRQARKLLAYAVDEMVRTHFPDESFAPFRNDVFNVFDKWQVTSNNDEY